MNLPTPNLSLHDPRFSIIHRLNSDSEQYIIIIDASGNVHYVSQGAYGGYIAKNAALEALRSGSYRMFLVKVKEVADNKTIRVKDEQLIVEDSYNEPNSELTELIKNLDAIHRGVIRSFVSSSFKYLRIVRYELYEAVPKSIDVKEDKGYAVIKDLDYTGIKYIAYAAIIYDRFYKAWSAARSTCQEVKAKLASEGFSDYAQQIYLVENLGRKGRYSEVRLKLPFYTDLPPLLPQAQAQQEERQQLQQKGLVPIVRGFLVISDLPSETRLKAKFDEIFENVKVGRKEIDLVRGFWINAMKRLRAEFDEMRLRYCIKLLPDKRGENLYILPLPRVADFMRGVEEIRKKLEILEKLLKQFLKEGKVDEKLLMQLVRQRKRVKLYPEYVDLVKKYLAQQGKLEEYYRRVEALTIADGFKVKLVPIAFSVDVVLEAVDEKVRAELEEHVKRFYAETIDAVKKRIAEEAKRVIEEVKPKLEQLRVAKALEQYQQKVRELEQLANSFSIPIMEIPELVELKTMVEGEVKLETLPRLEAALQLASNSEEKQ